MAGLCQREALNLVSQQIKHTVCHQEEPGEMKDGLVFLPNPIFSAFLLSTTQPHFIYLFICFSLYSLPSLSEWWVGTWDLLLMTLDSLFLSY